MEFIGDLIYLPLYPEGTDVVGTQLLAGQAEAQIPGGQPYSLYWMIGWSGGTSGIRKYFLPLHCTLEL